MATYSKGTGSRSGGNMTGTKPTRYGAGPSTPKMPAHGPGAGGMRKAGIAPGRHVENGAGRGGGKC